MSNKPSSPDPKWDPWVVYDGSLYQLFYLSGKTDQDPWWKTSWICGGYSQDLQNWTHTGALLTPSAKPAWASGRIFAGSTYKENDRLYLFYSAASQQDIAKEAIGLATSSDGVHWEQSDNPLLSWRDAKGICTENGVGYAGRCNLAGHLHWRDPYVVKCPVTNKYYLFFCTSLTSSTHYQGGLGVAVADKIVGPYQLLSPAAGPGVSPIWTIESLTIETSNADKEQWPFYHLERPQVIYFGGRYHLFFSCFKSSIDPLWLSTVGDHRVSDSTLYWYSSESITGPFKPTADLPVVAGSASTGLYGTTFFPKESKGDWSKVNQADGLEMAMLGWYHQDYSLSISQEFLGMWDKDELRIVENDI
ncbi:MAG: beta-fructosidase [Cyanobacteria bacterium J06649_4]